MRNMLEKVVLCCYNVLKRGSVRESYINSPYRYAGEIGSRIG